MREQFDVAVRAWAVPDYLRAGHSGAGRPYVDLGPSEWRLVFDTETTADRSQRLRIGTYQLHRRERLHHAGVFYEPESLTESELATLRSHAAERGWRVKTASEFVAFFLAVAWDRRGLVIGHNLPFDIARIAIAHRPAQSRDRSMRGAFSFKLSDDPKRSHVQIKRTNPGAAFIRLTIPEGRNPERENRSRGGRAPNHHGYFVDTATLAAALLGKRMKLGSLAETLDTEHRKLGDADHGADLTPEYLDYAMQDVRASWECFLKLKERYATYALPREPWQVYSEASIGKAHLEKMRLRPARRFPDSVMATIMETYYGGRAECSIRRVPVRGVYVDFASQYPTVFVLMGLWRYLTAEEIAPSEEDPAAVQALLDRVAIDDVLKPELWRELPVLVQVAPDGDRLPTRARYSRSQGNGTRRSSRAMNVGISMRFGGPAVWFTLADCIASALHTGKAPKVLRAIRFRPAGRQSGLRPIDVAGDPRYRVDPACDDFIKRLVEMRAAVRHDQKTADPGGDTSAVARLDAIQQGMKIAANATAYGSPIEMNAIEHRKPVGATVYLPDGSSYRPRLARTEKPGRWFNPLIATLVSAGGRLLLAAAMRLIADRAGSSVFNDTDSLFIAATRTGGYVPCPGGLHRTEDDEAAIRALTFAEVDAIVECFQALNPYERTAIAGSILEVERENFDPDSGIQREIECFAIAAKRYALFVRDGDGRPRIVGEKSKRKRSEHGLGHLLPPFGDEPETDDRDWLEPWWEHLLCRELGLDDPEPAWFSEPAVGRLTISSPRDLEPFKRLNEGKPRGEQVWPWNFLCLAHPTPLERARPGGPTCPVAAFEQDPRKRRAMPWQDRGSRDAEPLRIRTDDPTVFRDGTVSVLSYGNYFEQYRRHPESKSLGPDGAPCHSWTRGVLRPRHVEAERLRRIGKESNRLAEDPLPVGDQSEATIEYPEPRRCRGCDVEISGRRKWHSEACRKSFSRQIRLHPRPER